MEISPLAAETILQALRPVVHEHHEVETPGASLDELGLDETDPVDRG